MPLLIVLALVLGFLLFGNTHHDPAPPPGVTTGWPVDLNNPETACGIGIHHEDIFALTDDQLATARSYVARTCWGAPDNWPTDTDRHYYHR